LFDHEEVGSDSAQGAGSPVMLDALSRITSSFDSDSKVRYYLSMTSSSGMKLVIVSILVKL
jgi:aspartyl aminopeptidase